MAEGNPENENEGELKDEADLVSLDDLDSILDQEDPGFADSLSELKENLSGVEADIESIEIGEGAGDEAIIDAKPTRVGRLLAKIPFIGKIKSSNSKIWVKLGEHRSRATTQGMLLYQYFIIFIKTKPKEYLERIKETLNEALSFLKIQLAQFMALSKWKKMGWVGLSLLAFAAVFGVWQSSRSVWIPQIFSRPISNFVYVADSEIEIKNKEDSVVLYQYFGQQVARFLFKKIIVNLYVDEGSQRNPMALFEFLVDVDSEETAVELKSRESELHDRMQRISESFRYKDLRVPRGKKRLKKALKNDLNLALTQGWVSEVFFHTIVLKP